MDVLDRLLVSILKDEHAGKLTPLARESALILNQLYNYSSCRKRKNTGLCELEVVAIVTFLEDAYLQLSVTGCPDFRLVEKMKEPLYKTIEERINATHVLSQICEEQSETNIDTISKVARELRNSCISLLQTFQYTMKELASCGSYQSLQDYVIIPSFTSLEEFQLIEMMKSNVMKIKTVKRKLDECFDINQSEIDQEKCRLQRTKGYDVRLTEFHKKELDYIERWESCRRFQNSSKLRKAENEISKMIEDYRKNIFLENFAHHYIAKYIEGESKRLKLKHMEFECRREDDLDTLQWKYDVVSLKARHLRAEKKENAEKSELLQKQLNKYRGMQRREEAARLIQDWWRSKREVIRKKIKKEEKKKKKKKKKK